MSNKHWIRGSRFKIIISCFSKLEEPLYEMTDQEPTELTPKLDHTYERTVCDEILNTST